MAGGNTPTWRQAFNKAERAVGEPLEKAIETREFADMMSFGAKVRKGFQRQIYGTVNRTLHFVGLSTLKDTRDIARQLNRVQAQLREVSTQLEYLEEREQSREDAEVDSGPARREVGRTPASAPAKKATPAKKTTPAKKSAPAKKSTPTTTPAPAPAKTATPTTKSVPATKSAPAGKPEPEAAPRNHSQNDTQGA